MQDLKGIRRFLLDVYFRNMHQELLFYLTQAHGVGEIQIYKEVVCKVGKPPWSRKSHALLRKMEPLVLELEGWVLTINCDYHRNWW